MHSFAAFLSALLLVTPAVAQTTPRQPTITVGGMAEVELKPDLARIVAVVATQADGAAQAGELNRAATDRLLAKLAASGVKREDIRTTGVQVSPVAPRPRPDGTPDPRPPRFAANHTLRILTRDIDGVGRLSGEILAVGDTLLQSVTFGRDKDTEAEDEARRAAVANARHQAEVFALAAGVRLGRLVEIRNGSVQPVGPVAEPMMRMAAVREQALTLVPPASVRTSASVEMVFEIEQ